MLGLSFCETIDQLAMANSVCWYGHVLMREDGDVLRRALDFEVNGHRKKGRLKRTRKKQVKEESLKVGLRLIWQSSLVGDATRFYIAVSLIISCSNTI